MTTIAQVRQVVQPLLRRNPDLALVGRLVVVKPVRHVLRGIFIDRCSVPQLFQPAWAVACLFEPRISFALSWGGRVYRRSRGGKSWDVNDPLVPEYMAEAIEEQALPALRSVHSFDDFRAFLTLKQVNYPYEKLPPDRRIWIDVALGDLDMARTHCPVLVARAMYYQRLKLRTMIGAYDFILENLCPLLAADDRPGLVRLLHACEAGSAKSMKLEKLWEPSPFPLEEAENL